MKIIYGSCTTGCKAFEIDNIVQAAVILQTGDTVLVFEHFPIKPDPLNA
jgi:hypothetical protein